MIVHLDDDFKCFTQAAEDRTAVETDAFDGKCAAYIEGYRLVPAGSSWTREDGVVFRGEMIAPFKDSVTLDTAQKLYDELSPVIDDLLVALCSSAGI